MTFLAVSGPVLNRFAVYHGVLLLWSLLAGLFTGAAFPAMLRLASETVDGDERDAAAAIELSDHLGAAFGAFVTGIVWLPLFGLSVTCLFFAGLKAVGFLGDGAMIAVRLLKSKRSHFT
jgi:predicted membrane-bound spermidine synthase